MPRLAHEIPTHLDVQDKLIFGLTARQFLYLLLGASVAYAVWDQPTAVPIALKAALVLGALAIAATLALVRPARRPLEAWLVVALLYAARPRQSTWCSAEPDAGHWRPSRGAWKSLSPDLHWGEEEDDLT